MPLQLEYARRFEIIEARLPLFDKLQRMMRSESPSSSSPRRAISVAVAVAVSLSMAVLVPSAACRNDTPSGRKNSTKATVQTTCSTATLERTRTWLKTLCLAHRGRLTLPLGWWGLPLARADAQLLSSSPTGTLVQLTPRVLWINHKRAPDWPKPRGWKPPDLTGGVGPVLARLVKRLDRLLGGNKAAAAIANAALSDMVGRSEAQKTAPGAPPAPPAPRPPSMSPKLTGLTVLMLVTAKLQQGGLGKKTVNVAIAPKVPMEEVIQLQALLALAGFDVVNLLVAPTQAPFPPTPPVPALNRTLDAYGPRRQNRAVQAGWRRALAAETQRWVTQGCPAMATLQHDILSLRETRRCEPLSRQLPKVISACGCRLDEFRLLTLWQGVLGPYTFLGSWTGRLDPQDASPLAVPHNAPWQELAGKIVKHRRTTLWLTLQP